MNLERSRAYTRTTPPKQVQPTTDDRPWGIDDHAVAIVKRSQNDEGVIHLDARQIERR